MALAALDVTRTTNGQFAPGHSGNPAGRPKGSRNKATLLAEMLEEGEPEALVRALADRAHGGDQMALRLLVGRLVPKASAPPIRLPLPEGAESDPDALVTATIRALADGEVTPEEAVLVARVAVAAHKVKGGATKRRAAARVEEAAPVAEDETPSGESLAEGAGPVPLAAGEGEAAAEAGPVIRLFPLAAPVAGTARAVAGGDLGEAAEAADDEASARVSSLFFGAPGRRDGAGRERVAARA